jgi:hypothetical protein
MSKSRTWGLTVLFLAIALFVSGSLVTSLRTAYAANGQSAAFSDALHLLQRA